MRVAGGWWRMRRREKNEREDCTEKQIAKHMIRLLSFATGASTKLCLKCFRINNLQLKPIPPTHFWEIEHKRASECFFFTSIRFSAARAAIFLLQLKHSARKFAQIDWVGMATRTKNSNFTMQFYWEKSIFLHFYIRLNIDFVYRLCLLRSTEIESQNTRAEHKSVSR